MGSFCATCVISNLPIQYGDKVRYFLLTRSRFHTEGNDHICYVQGRWQLRSAAIRAKYNDAGSIEHIEDSFTAKMLFEGLNLDAVEKGVGDNQVHDVHVRRGMSQEEWLEALWEGRVFVLDATASVIPTSNPLPPPPEPEEGMPSLTRLEKLLTANNFKVVTAYHAEGFVLDEVSTGFIRIRTGTGFGPEMVPPLQSILPVLHGAGYAAMLTCGTGSYARHAEVLVAPNPAPTGKHFHTRGVADDTEHEALLGTRPRPVAQVMVREDVWQYLVTTSFETWEGRVSCDRMKADALAWLRHTQEVFGSKDSTRLMFFNSEMDHKNMFSAATYRGEGISGFSLREAFRLGIKLAPSPEALEAYMLDLAEIAYVQWAYSHLGGQWQPTSNTEQSPEWKDYQNFHQQLVKIAKKKVREYA